MKELQTQAELPTIAPAPEMTPMALMQQAVAHGVGADELGKLMALQERWEASKAQKAFSAALAGFQAVVPTITKNKTADRYQYATFDHIMRTIKPYMETAGLALRFTTELTGESIITATCTVTHRDGHSETSAFAAPVDAQMRVNSTQKMGSANSYAKRYCLVNALNLSVGEQDDDGASASELESDRPKEAPPAEVKKKLPPQELANAAQLSEIKVLIKKKVMSPRRTSWVSKRMDTLTKTHAAQLIKEAKAEAANADTK
jgi:hypothetical protein